MSSFPDTVRKLRSLLRRAGRSQEDADDLIQEAFLRLHIYCQVEAVQHEEAFLCRTVRNLSIDLHRKEHHALYSKQRVEDLELIDFRPSPDEDLAVHERLDKAASVLSKLSPRTREIFVMHRIEGHPCSHIAKHFRISISAVEKHIARAVLALMEVVDQT